MNKQKITQALSGNLIEVALGFALIMFITRNYGQSEAGVYFLIMAIVAVLNSLKEGFLQNGFVKYYIEHGRDSSVLRSGLMITWSWDVFNIAVFTTISLFNEALQDFVPFYMVQTLTFSLYRWTLFVHKSVLNLRVIFRVNILVLVCAISGLLVVYLWELPITYCLLVIGCSYGFATWSFPTNRSLLVKALSAPKDMKKVKELAAFGKFGLMKEMAGAISHHSGVFLSAFFLTMGDTALLGLANRYAVLISIPGSSLSGLIYPLLLKVGFEPQGLKKAAREGIGKMYALLIPLAFGICVASPFLIVGLHGSAYGLAALILIARVLLTTILLPMGTGYSSIMNVMNCPERITKLVLITSVVNIATMLVTMPLLGIWGAILSPAITEVVGFYIMKKGFFEIELRLLDITRQVLHFWKFWTKNWNLQMLTKESYR